MNTLRHVFLFLQLINMLDPWVANDNSFDICAGCFFYGFHSETLIFVVAWKLASLRFEEENKYEYEILLNLTFFHQKN